MPDKDPEAMPDKLFNDIIQNQASSNNLLNQLEADGDDDGEPDQKPDKGGDDNIDLKSVVSEMKTLSKRFADTQQYVKTIEGENKGLRDSVSELRGKLDVVSKIEPQSQVSDRDVMAEVKRRHGKEIAAAVREHRDNHDDGLASYSDEQVVAMLAVGAEFSAVIDEVRNDLTEKATKKTAPKGGDSKEPKDESDARLSVLEKQLAKLVGRQEIEDIGDPNFDLGDEDVLEIVKPLVEKGVPLKDAYTVWKAKTSGKVDDDTDPPPRRSRKQPSKSRGGNKGEKRLTANEKELSAFDEAIRRKIGIPKNLWDKM